MNGRVYRKARGRLLACECWQVTNDDELWRRSLLTMISVISVFSQDQPVRHRSQRRRLQTRCRQGRERRSGGRMVGIITHIRDLTERLPGCIEVEKGLGQSRWQVARVG